MKHMKGTLGLLVAILILGMGINVCGSGGPVSWKEEVLLHDGQKIIVERSQTLGGKPTLESRERVILEEEWVFPVPGTEQKTTWKTDHRNPPQGESLSLVLVGFVKHIPYIATSSAGCVSYNHWGRPNPPYVFFRYNGKEWQRISLAEFPEELKEANVVVGRPDPQHRSSLLSIATIKEENHGLELHLRQIIREPADPTHTESNVACPDYNSKQYRSFKAPLPISPTTEKQ